MSYTQLEYIDAMVPAYFEAIDFTNTANPDFPEFEDAEFAAETKTEGRDDIARFVADNWPILESLAASPEQVAYDLWLTRNGHGAGFWDREYADEATLQALTAKAEAMGGRDLYAAENGLIYFGLRTLKMLTDITATVLPSGNLELTADNDEAREELRDRLEDNGQMGALSDALESYFTNGEYYPFDAGVANPFVGLTDAPCIAESMELHDDGRNEVIGRLWYFAEYMLECPVETLIETGRVEFTLVS